MGFIESIYERARRIRQRIAIPECTNPVMLRAAMRAGEAGIADIVLVGEKEKIAAAADAAGLSLAAARIADTNDEAYAARLVERYGQLPARVMGQKSIARRIHEPLYMAMVMEAVGDVDCTIAGLDATTGEVVMAGTGVIGLSAGTATASAFFLVELEAFDGEQGNCIAMSDGGITVEPTPEQLASIAISSCESFQALVGREAYCAMLSHSTCGSASGPAVTRVQEAVRLAAQARSDLKIDGEFQVDAAVVKRVGEKKVKRFSEVAGRANVLIFPEIASCNIGSKMVQIFARCNTYGPLLQGFRLPVCDCSRSDTEDKIVDNMAASAVLAAYWRNREAVRPKAESEA